MKRALIFGWLYYLCFSASVAASPAISARKIGGLEAGFFASGDINVSSDGRFLAMLSVPDEKGSDCVVFERKTHKSWLVPGSSRMEPLFFSRDGKALWVWGLHRDVPMEGVKNVPADAPFIALYDLQKKRFRCALAGKKDWSVPSDSALSRDGETLIMASQDGWIRGFNTSNGRQKWKRRAQTTDGAPLTLTLSPDGSRLLRFFDETNAVQRTEIVSTRSGRILKTLRLQLRGGMMSAFQDGQFAPRGEMIAVFRPDTQEWVFFDGKTSRVQWKMGGPSQNSEGALSWQWSPDARWILVVGPQGFQVRDARNGRIVKTAKTLDFSPSALAFSPDGKLVYALADNDTGFGAETVMWQLRLRGTAKQKRADQSWLQKTRAAEKQFALSPRHINQSLIQAAQHGDAQRVAFLLDRGADIETRNGRGETPLMNALNAYDDIGLPTVKLLLARGAKVARDGGSLLASAAADGNDELLRVFIARGAKVNADASAYGTTTALHAAVKSGKVSSARLLLDNGANPNAIDEDGASPLYASVGFQGDEANEIALARLLLEHGAKINFRTTQGLYDVSGQTTLAEAARLDQPNLLDVLLQNGADPNLANSEGETPLIQIAQNDKTNSDSPDAQRLKTQLRMVKALLAHGADPKLRDKAGNTAFSLAVSPELKAALKS